jgi:histidine ammonia-lyase
MLGYSAAAAAGELRLLATPVSLETPTTSIDEGIDDRVVLTALASRRLADMVGLARHVIAVELVCAAQAIDLRDRRAELGGGAADVYDVVRELVPFTRSGEPIAADLAPLESRVAGGLVPTG